MPDHSLQKTIDQAKQQHIEVSSCSALCLVEANNGIDLRKCTLFLHKAALQRAGRTGMAEEILQPIPYAGQGGISDSSGMAGQQPLLSGSCRDTGSTVSDTITGSVKM